LQALALVLAAATSGALAAPPPEWTMLHAPPGVALAPAPLPPSGLRYQITRRASLVADPPGLHRAGSDPGEPEPGAKIGMEWKPAKAPWRFEHGAVGLYMHSGYRLALKPQHGGLGLYLRGQF